MTEQYTERLRPEAPKPMPADRPRTLESCGVYGSGTPWPIRVGPAARESAGPCAAR